MKPIKEISLHPGRTETWSTGTENCAVFLTCDLSAYLAVWPDAQPAVAFERADGTKYAHSWTLVGRVLHVPLLRADTEIPGVCKCMISVLSGDGQANTATYCGRVTPGIDTLSEPPAAPEQGVIEQVNAAAAKAQSALDHMQERYYVPSVSADGVLSWTPSAPDMPAVPDTSLSVSAAPDEAPPVSPPAETGGGVFFVHITGLTEDSPVSEQSFADIANALSNNQMVVAVLEHTYFLPLIGIQEEVAIFSMVASFDGSVIMLSVIYTADGTIMIDGM